MYAGKHMCELYEEQEIASNLLILFLKTELGYQLCLLIDTVLYSSFFLSVYQYLFFLLLPWHIYQILMMFTKYM